MSMVPHFNWLRSSATGVSFPLPTTPTTVDSPSLLIIRSLRWTTSRRLCLKHSSQWQSGPLSSSSCQSFASHCDCGSECGKCKHWVGGTKTTKEEEGSRVGGDRVVTTREGVKSSCKALIPSAMSSTPQSVVGL